MSPGMELRHLRYFLAVAEELHFGRAATRLHMSQPPLSQQIQRLEKELQAPLFYRTKRRVELTNAGRALLGEARALVAQAEHAAGTAQRASRGEIGQLLVGCALWTDFLHGAKIIQQFTSAASGSRGRATRPDGCRADTCSGGRAHPCRDSSPPGPQ